MGINSRGVLLYASTDFYMEMAMCVAKQVHQHLQVSVTLVTDSDYSETHSNYFDHVIEVPEVGRPERLLAHDLSPYDETLLLDVDLMILNDSFKHVWGTQEELLVNHKIRYLDGTTADAADRYISHNTTRLYWMTAMYFRKTPYVKRVFDMMCEVRKHWEYYRFLYGFQGREYRNDFALSVALHTLAGMADHTASLPVDYLTFAKQNDRLLDASPDRMIWLHTNSASIINTGNLNVHCLNKTELLHHLDKMVA